MAGLHGVENRAAGRAQARFVGRHAGRHPWDIRNFVRAQTESIRLAGFTLLIGHFERMRRNGCPKAEDGGEHKARRVISYSTTIHNVPPTPQMISV